MIQEEEEIDTEIEGGEIVPQEVVEGEEVVKEERWWQCDTCLEGFVSRSVAYTVQADNTLPWYKVSIGCIEESRI